MRLFASVRAHSDLISAIGVGPSALHQTLIEVQAPPEGDAGQLIPAATT